MKKIITNFLLLIFCSVPRFIKAQMGIDKINIINGETNSEPRFIQNISFTPSSDLLSHGVIDIRSASKKELDAGNVLSKNRTRKNISAAD